MPLREHLIGVMERTGKVPARLRDAAQCPPALRYLWDIFLRLRKRSTPSLGSARILYSDMLAFQSVTGVRFAPWEVAALERLDDAMEAK